MAAFTPPPSAPQRGDRATFSQRMDAFLTWLVALIPQLNTFIANLNSRDLGGANTFIFTFDGATGDGDPGPGRLRLGSNPQNTSNVMRVDIITEGGIDIGNVFNALATVTSNAKGSVRIQRVNDPAAWMLFDILSVAGTGTGYRNLSVVLRGSSGPDPFVNGDSLAVFFDRNGDKGDAGGTPTSQQIRDAVGIMPIANGGTGATTATGARAAIGAMDAAVKVLVRNAFNHTGGTTFDSGSMPNIASISAANEAFASLEVANDSNQAASAVMCFHRRGAYAAYFGLDTDNRWKVGGRSMGGVAYEIFHQGNFNPNNYALLGGANFWGNISAPVITQTSDERKKTNWRELEDWQLDALASMTKAGVFDWVDGGSSAGGSAQQIQAVVPEVVHADSKGILSVDYGGLNFAIAQATLRRLKRAGIL